MDDSLAGTRLRPIIRVFVSSTFSDLKLERDALQQRVFLKLEQRCQEAGFQFQAIDLRWGVSIEAGLDHRTMRICFEELRRSQEISPQPNFLILLGDRYGWRPLPEEISASDFRSLTEAAELLNESSAMASVPATERCDAAATSTVELLHRWYRLDKNALTPTWFLQPRHPPKPGDPDGRDYTTAQAWGEVERTLRQIIQRAFPASGLKDRFATPHSADQPPPSVVRFQASATEQEIWAGAFSVPNASQHVLAFFREIDPPRNISNAEQLKDYFDVASGAIDTHPRDAQRELKAEIKRRLGGNSVELPRARLSSRQDNTVAGRHGRHMPQQNDTVRVSIDHIDELCREVERRLTELIDREVEQYWCETPPPDAVSRTLRESADTESMPADHKQDAAARRAARELEIERDEHLRFGLERGPKETFVGRQDQLDRILEHVSGDSRWPLVIHGTSGCGKTALLARAAQQVAELPICRDHPPIVRFIGVTPQSSELRSLLTSLCQELRQRFATLPVGGPFPTEIRELIEEFRKHLFTESATARQPVILFLDALDQLSEADDGRQLLWIPSAPLPGHVKLVVSCLSDRGELQDGVESLLPERSAGSSGQPASGPCSPPSYLNPYFVLRSRTEIPADNWRCLNALSHDEAQRLLFEVWLRSVGRTVDPDQRRHIDERLSSSESEACRQPLYLKLLFEEVRLWRAWAEPNEQTSDRLSSPRVTYTSGDSVPALLEQLFERLRRPENHGDLLIERALGYIAAARRGLSETEILEVLFADPDYKQHLVNTSQDNKHTLPEEPPRIPIATWSRLHSDLAPYLSLRAAPGGNVLTMHHREIAEWVAARFVDLKGPTPQSNWRPHERLVEYFFKRGELSDRVLDEYPWQLAEAEDWTRLRDTLTNIAWFTMLVPEHTYQLLSYWLQLQPHFDLAASYLEAFERLSERDPARLMRGMMAHRFAHFLRTAGRLPEAATLMDRSLGDLERIFGRSHPNVMAALNNAAGLYRDVGRLDEAEELYRELIRRYVDVDDTNCQGYFERLDNLGVLLASRGKIAEAVELQEAARAGLARLLGESHLDAVQADSNLAMSLQKSGDLQGAELILRRVVDELRHAVGDEHPRTLIARDNLGLVLIGRRKWEEAEGLLAGNLDRFRRSLGESHPDTLHCCSLYGEVLLQTNKVLEAEQLLTTALNNARQRLGSDDTLALTLENNLAGVLNRQGRTDEAAALFSRVRERLAATLGPDHPTTLGTEHNVKAIARPSSPDSQSADEPSEFAGEEDSQTELAPDEHPIEGISAELIMGMMGAPRELLQPTWTAVDYRCEMAEACLAEDGNSRDGGFKVWLASAVALAAETPAPNTEDDLDIATRCARLFYDWGELVASSRLFEVVTPLAIERFGLEHAVVLSVCSNAAVILGMVGETAKSLTLYDQIYEPARKVFGPDHERTINIEDELARLLRDSGALDRAELLFLRVIEARSRSKGPEDDLTVIAWNRLGTVYALAGRHSDAERIFRQVVEIRERTLGRMNSDTLWSQHCLAESLAAQGKWTEAQSLARSVATTARQVLPANDLDIEMYEQHVETTQQLATT